MDSDQELIRRIQAGDAGAFDALFDRYSRMLRRHMAGMVRDEAAADDLLQETFLRVWTRAEQYVGQGGAKGWLFRIATNQALNHLRSARRRRQQPLEARQADDGDAEQTPPAWMVDDTVRSPQAELEAAEQLELWRRLVDGLDEPKRQVYSLFYDRQMDMRAVAEELGIPLGTAKSRLHHTRKILAEAWKELSGEWENL